MYEMEKVRQIMFWLCTCLCVCMRASMGVRVCVCVFRLLTWQSVCDRDGCGGLSAIKSQ